MPHIRRFFYCLTFPTLVFIFSCNIKKEHSDIMPSVYVQKLEKGYQLYRNGTPFKIMGAGANTYFEELKNAGANTIRLYDTTSLDQKLDKAHQLNLAVVLDIPVPRFTKKDTFYSNPKKVEQLIDGVGSFVKKYKDHPALLYWMLGNEVQYPNLWTGNDFSDCFNQLIDLLHQVDENHPVSTAIAGFRKKQILSIEHNSPKLDFISINVFGQLSSFSKFRKKASFFWKGPYVLSEWGINGPWEAKNTLWGAPIEQTSTKKAQQFRERYEAHIATLDDGRSLGHLAFFWGQKQERTHTWFSLFSEEGKKTQTLEELQSIWKSAPPNYKGPEIEYMLLEEKGAADNIILTSDQQAKATVFHKKTEHGLVQIHWEIRSENWNYNTWDVEKRMIPVPYTIKEQHGTDLVFTVPKEEGPYRLFVYLEDTMGNIATTNTPFYILNPSDESSL